MKLCTKYYSDPTHNAIGCNECEALIRQIREQIAGHEAMVAKLQERLANAYRRITK